MVCVIYQLELTLVLIVCVLYKIYTFDIINYNNDKKNLFIRSSLYVCDLTNVSFFLNGILMNGRVSVIVYNFETAKKNPNFYLNSKFRTLSKVSTKYFFNPTNLNPGSSKLERNQMGT